MLDKGLVATPTEEYLNDFLNANNGSNDFLLTQMAKNYGYKLALLNMLLIFHNKKLTYLVQYCQQLF